MIELLELSRVLDAVRTTGTEVRYHHEQCQAGEISGFYRIGPSVDQLVVCPRNHLNHSDLFDTIRHEAIHVVQACKGDAILPYDYYLENATDNARDAVSEYPQDRRVQHYELEAFTAAELLSEQQVVNLINTYCFE